MWQTRLCWLWKCVTGTSVCWVGKIGCQLLLFACLTTLPRFIRSKGDFLKLWKLRNWVLISLTDIRETNERFMIVHRVSSLTVSSSQQGVLFAGSSLWCFDVTWPVLNMSLLWLGQVNDAFVCQWHWCCWCSSVMWTFSCCPMLWINTNWWFSL